MAVPAPDEDVVTLAANAALDAMNEVDPSTIGTVIFATESGIDQSKAAAIYVHHLLGLPSNCRTVEMKQACCSSTSALHFAMASVALHPQKKVLIVASDIARYGLGSAGEPTQGAGAVAMVISATPKILTVDTEVGYFTEDVMDFWRPNYLEEAVVDGKYSIKVYMNALENAWREYREQRGARVEDFNHLCYHLPFTRMALKAHLHLARVEQAQLDSGELQKQVEPSLGYNRQTGNAYTASLYMGLLSLLDQSDLDLTGKRIGFFSYGSGCMGAFFGATVSAGYREALAGSDRPGMLANRRMLSMEEYEAFYRHELPSDGSAYETPMHDTGAFRLSGIRDHQRIYETVTVRELMAVAGAAEAYAAAPVA
jgi:hydroxymethylglutaryl-CoA synthase